MNLYEIRPSSACFNPLQLVYPMYVQKWKVQSETNHGKIYVPLTNGLIFTRKNREYFFQSSSAHRSSYFWISVTDLFQTDAGNGPLWINRDSNSNVMWNWRNPHFDQPLTNHVQLELFPWKVKESGTTAPYRTIDFHQHHSIDLRRCTQLSNIAKKNSVAQWGWTNTNASVI